MPAPRLGARLARCLKHPQPGFADTSKLVASREPGSAGAGSRSLARGRSEPIAPLTGVPCRPSCRVSSTRTSLRAHFVPCWPGSAPEFCRARACRSPCAATAGRRTRRRAPRLLTRPLAPSAAPCALLSGHARLPSPSVPVACTPDATIALLAVPPLCAATCCCGRRLPADGRRAPLLWQPRGMGNREANGGESLWA